MAGRALHLLIFFKNKHLSAGLLEIMKPTHKKILLFIEPSLSDAHLLLHAKRKGNMILVMSAYSHPETFPEEILNTSSIFFQLDLNDNDAVLDLVGQILKKFPIDEIIPGSDDYLPLAKKVADYLNKPDMIIVSREIKK